MRTQVSESNEFKYILLYVNKQNYDRDKTRTSVGDCIVRTRARALSRNNRLMYTQANNAVIKYIAMLRSLTQAALDHALH